MNLVKMPNVCLSFVLLFTIFIIVVTQKLVPCILFSLDFPKFRTRQHLFANKNVLKKIRRKYWWWKNSELSQIFRSVILKLKQFIGIVNFQIFSWIFSVLLSFVYKHLYFYRFTIKRKVNAWKRSFRTKPVYRNFFEIKTFLSWF